MRRVLLTCLILAIVALQAAQAEAPRPDPGAPLYSNLDDESVLEWTLDALRTADVSEAAVEQLRTWVEDYNAVSKGNPVYTVTGAFAPMEGGAVRYGEPVEDYYAFNYRWWKAARKDYWDVLCRSTAYSLTRNRIDVAEPLAEADWEKCWLESDHNGIASNPGIQWTQAEKAAYFTLFDPMFMDETAGSADAAYSRVLEKWKAHGVVFRDGGASLLTLWCEWHENGRYVLFASHAAVLVHLPEGGCLVFEKIRPDYPYQATLFASEDEVSDYFDAWLNANDLQPEYHFLLKNGEQLS